MSSNHDDQFDNDDAMSHIDDAEMLDSDLEDDDPTTVESKPDDHEDEDHEDKEEEFVIQRNKLHQIKITSEDDDNTIIVVRPENRVTSDHMTFYEYTHVVGVRATHISNGSPIYTSIENLDNPIDIAKKEIRENKCPLSIKRRLGSTNMVEIWSVNEMVKPHI